MDERSVLMGEIERLMRDARYLAKRLEVVSSTAFYRDIDSLEKTFKWFAEIKLKEAGIED